MNIANRLVLALVLCALASPALAARHHARGACDGIHRCVCGTTQANHFGLPWTYNGHNLKQAREWTRAFPHTTIHAGAVGYQRGGGPTGHVFRVVAYNGGCTATVADERGTYERDVCSRGATFMNVGGLGATYSARRTTSHTTRHHARSSPQVASGDALMARFGAAGL